MHLLVNAVTPPGTADDLAAYVFCGVAGPCYLTVAAQLQSLHSAAKKKSSTAGNTGQEPVKPDGELRNQLMDRILLVNCI